MKGRVVILRRFVLIACLIRPFVSAAPAIADNPGVVMKNFDFSPMAITVPAGTTVTWKNLDGEPHTVTSADGLFRSPALDQNDTWSFRFTKAGVYKYICSIHPRMI